MFIIWDQLDAILGQSHAENMREMDAESSKSFRSFFRFAVLNYGKGTKHRELNTGFHDSLSPNTHQEISAHGESFKTVGKKSYRLFKVSFVDELGWNVIFERERSVDASACLRR